MGMKMMIAGRWRRRCAMGTLKGAAVRVTALVPVYAKSVTRQYCESDGKALGYRGTVCGLRWEHTDFRPPVYFSTQFSSAYSKCYILAWRA